MAVAPKLSPAAAPFPGPYAPPQLHHLAPPAPPPSPLADATCPPQFSHVTYCCVAAPPAGQPPSPPAGAPAMAVHGGPSNKLMAAFSGRVGAGKLQAAAGEAAKPCKGPAPAAVVPALVPAPQPVHTTRRPQWWKKLPEPVLGWHSYTVMLRNIPNKLRSSDMIELLDQHCKLVNEAAGNVVSAYDVLYLPMDSRRGCNFGYAFINFTSTMAARMLYCSLQGCAWTVYGSKKVIHIVPAKIQGHASLVRHLNQLKLERDDEEFLPAVFSPARDGVTAGPTTVRRLGRVAHVEHYCRL